MTTSSKIVLGKQPCPSCTSSDAYHEYDDGHGYCFSCQTYFPGQRKENFTISNYTYEYIPIRGIERAALIKYDIKTKVDPDGKPVAMGFKYPNGSHKVRHLNKKEFYWAEGEQPRAGLFGKDKFSEGEHKYVTIVEGELDAASLWQVVGSPVVSVQSASSALRDVVADRSFLNSFERVYLAFDADTPGRTATAAVARAFDYNKVYDVRYGKHKDANEYLQAGESSELYNIWWNAKRYQPDTVVSTFQEFEKILTEPPKPGIPYPFPALNEMTYGIRTGESVLITAQEGVGKTELMHAIEYQILKETKDAVGAIFLEEPKRRHLQAVAGLELQRPVHLPDCNCSDSEVIAALRKAVAEDERLHVYSHFGSDDPDSLIDTIRYLVGARDCRYILFDHISMAVSGLAGDDERRALDYLSTRLEMMVKELDFALILVSHVNDEGKTRGSRYISKIADIRIDATRDVSNASPIERNTTHLLVSKNRFSGRTGPACSLLFDPTTYTFTEISNDNWSPPEQAANDNSGTEELVLSAA
jgi:replicative DNA helicase